MWQIDWGHKFHNLQVYFLNTNLQYRRVIQCTVTFQKYIQVPQISDSEAKIKVVKPKIWMRAFLQTTCYFASNLHTVYANIDNPLEVVKLLDIPYQKPPHLPEKVRINNNIIFKKST